jgi:uncharacterized protein (DUF305 family)
MNTKKLPAILVALIVGLVLGFIAAPRLGGMMSTSHEMQGQMPGMNHDMMSMGQPKGDQGQSSKAYAEANAAMHKAMDIEFSGNADVDFAKGMIAHHQGAIDMAKVLLEHGKDAEMRALGEKIIAAQQPEIDQMNAWLAKNGN